MHIKEVKYTKEFQYHGVSEWIGATVEVQEGEDAKSALNTAKALVDEFYSEISPEHNGSVVIQKPKFTGEVDNEFEALKAKLSLIEFREEAQEYLDTTPFKFAIEAKLLINSKPLKNK